MTVAGNGIIENCRKCYVDNGFGVRLDQRGSEYVCRYCNSRYAVEGGLMKRL
jgi:DNA-directed RNA polymerase subunit RPC12/RpoP